MNRFTISLTGYCVLVVALVGCDQVDKLWGQVPSQIRHAANEASNKVGAVLGRQEWPAQNLNGVDQLARTYRDLLSVEISDDVAVQEVVNQLSASMNCVWTNFPKEDAVSIMIDLQKAQLDPSVRKSSLDSISITMSKIDWQDLNNWNC